MLRNERNFGSSRDRVDGRAKVTGAAQYAAEFDAPGLLYGYVVSSTIAKGQILSIDVAKALDVPGVLKVFTHENRPQTAWFSYNYRDEVAPPGKPFRPLYDEQVVYSGQPIALVVAESFDIARHAASLVTATYKEEPHETDLRLARAAAYVPPKKRQGMKPPPNKGDAMAAYERSPFRIANEYSIATEHHNPMEPHASTVIFEGDGKLTIHDKIQGVMNTQSYVSAVFGLSSSDIHVVSPFVGGGFGSGLRPQYQLFLAVMAALDMERSVRVEMTRENMFTFTHRPETINTVMLGADETGRLGALRHEAVAVTSRFEDYQEVVVNWSGILYDAENKQFDYRIAQVDTYTPGDMRAPGAPLGTFAIESAMDELAYAANIDPMELRLRNYSVRDDTTNKEFTSKELRACFRMGAEKFGWSQRDPKPRSMREGRELIGWGMASGAWEAQFSKTSAKAVAKSDGTLEVGTATADIGTGTYTILTQIGADALGLDMEQVTAKLADTTLPASPVEGGSWTAASAGTAVQMACEALKKALLEQAQKMEGSPLASAKYEDVTFANGRIFVNEDPGRSVTLEAVVRASGEGQIEAQATAKPDPAVLAQYAGYTHSAAFVEVRVDEQLGLVRIPRIVNAVAAGRIINPKTARSQVIGGVVWGIGMALHEETLTDHNLGRFMNRNLAEYHVPANADIHDIDVIFVPEEDDKVSPIGVKGLGEIGIVATAAAVANAIYHATGKRIRELPITIDKVLREAA
ncbi:MAG: xanthine dehydrogenase family protein molybdopterin-binding subunit [Methylobacterium mesophilicum]|nr:xanthine dehydrogenase family protein molybdopterin-binding subunit [Methylobacterium mesophilicum]